MKLLVKALIGAAVVGAVVMAGALWFIRVPSIDASSGNKSEAIQAWFEERHNGRVAQFNGAALVVDDGSILVRDAWGQDGDNRPHSTSSQFRLASVSKSFTAAAILRLADLGQVDLDQPLSEQMEGCSVRATPAQLLQHQSGLPDSYMQEASPDQTLTISTAVIGICKSAREAEQPGDFSYNNSGYVLLAGLVEQKTDMSFETYLRNEILVPLGLSDTRVWNLVSEDQFDEIATGFNDDGKLVPTYLDGVAGDGGVVSTVDDLRNWARFWLDDRLISRELKDRAIGRGIGDGYHFGFNRDGRRISHHGSWLGARTYFGFEDDEGKESVVVLLDNSSSIFIDDIQNALWQAIE